MDTRSKSALVISSALLMVIAAAPATAQQPDDQATATVIHAVPGDRGFPADVYLDGELVIDGFTFETATEPFAIPAGDVTLAIYPDGADPAADDPAVSQTITIEPGADHSIVAQLLDGSPVVTVFRNEVGAVDAGRARLTIRQTSSAPPVDVLIDDDVLLTGLEAPNGTTTELGAGVYAVSLARGGEALAQQDIDLGEGELTVIYAVGSPDDGSFGFLVQVVSGLDTAPAGVPTGTGGSKGATAPSALPALAAALGVVAMIFSQRRRRA